MERGIRERNAPPLPQLSSFRCQEERENRLENSTLVIAMALTSQPQRAEFPLTLELAGAILPKNSWVKISQVRTPSVERLSRKIGRAKPEEVELAITGLNQIVAS